MVYSSLWCTLCSAVVLRWCVTCINWCVGNCSTIIDWSRGHRIATDGVHRARAYGVCWLFTLSMNIITAQLWGHATRIFGNSVWKLSCCCCTLDRELFCSSRHESVSSRYSLRVSSTQTASIFTGNWRERCGR